MQAWVYFVRKWFKFVRTQFQYGQNKAASGNAALRIHGSQFLYCIVTSVSLSQFPSVYSPFAAIYIPIFLSSL